MTYSKKSRVRVAPLVVQYRNPPSVPQSKLIGTPELDELAGGGSWPRVLLMEMVKREAEGRSSSRRDDGRGCRRLALITDGECFAYGGRDAGHRRISCF